MTSFLILAVVFAICLLIGLPIAISIGASTLVTVVYNGLSLGLLAQISFSGLDKYVFIAIPMFILAGSIMEVGGISRKIVDFASSFIGKIDGGLAIVTIIACMFFAAISGSSGATVAAVGTMMIPTMVKKGYDKDFAGAVTASSGSLGMLIPPSIAMIVYAVMANVSVGKMFVAGIIPGTIIGLVLIVVTFIISRKRGYKGELNPLNLRNIISTFWEAKWSLVLPVIILGGIYSGIFTPTEASVTAVIYAFFIAVFIHKELSIKELPKIFVDAAVTTGSVMIILGMALSFARILILLQIPQKFAEFMFSLTDSKFLIILFFIIMIFITGLFMESTAQILIYTPLFLPILPQLGMDPIHFGIILIIGTEIGLLTPPVGVNLFIAQGITQTKIGGIAREVLPFMLSMFIILLILAYIPAIVTFLPDLLYR